MVGVKETKDVVTLGKVVTVEIVKAVCKDGFQLADLGAFLRSPDFEKAVVQAVDGIELVPVEAADFGLLDGLELGKHVYSCVTDIVAELKACAKKK